MDQQDLDMDPKPIAVGIALFTVCVAAGMAALGLAALATGAAIIYGLIKCLSFLALNPFVPLLGGMAAAIWFTSRRSRPSLA